LLCGLLEPGLCARASHVSAHSQPSAPEHHHVLFRFIKPSPGLQPETQVASSPPPTPEPFTSLTRSGSEFHLLTPASCHTSI
jgi:hypothetical protein